MVTDRVAELTDAGFRVVVFSVHVKPLIVQAVMDAGACAFLDKRTERDQFVDTSSRWPRIGRSSPRPWPADCCTGYSCPSGNKNPFSTYSRA